MYLGAAWIVGGFAGFMKERYYWLKHADIITRVPESEIEIERT
jgi:hypothetical protein